MPPKPCPKRLQRLIDNEPHALRLILRALQARRQSKGPETFALESTSRVTINLDDYTVTVRTELALALAEIDPPDKIDLIRECPECNCVFWAGRDDKKACDKHAGQWRKKKHRRKEKAEAEIRAAEREDTKLKRALQGLSKTAVALLNAIVIEGIRTFYKIDFETWRELKEDSQVRRVPNLRIVRRTLKMLVDREYLTHHPHRHDSDLDMYVPEQKISKVWTEMRRKPPDRPTH